MTTDPVYSKTSVGIDLLGLQAEDVPPCIEFDEVSVAFAVALEVLDFVSSEARERIVSIAFDGSDLAGLHFGFLFYFGSVHPGFKVVIVVVVSHQDILGPEVSHIICCGHPGYLRQSSFIEEQSRLISGFDDPIALVLEDTEIEETFFVDRELEVLSLSLVSLNVKDFIARKIIFMSCGGYVGCRKVFSELFVSHYHIVVQR